jgi:TolB-like protein
LLRKPAGDPLEFRSLLRDEVQRPAAGFATIRWTASVAGGKGELRYEFRTLEGSVEVVEQQGSSPTWLWRPSRPGTYRVKATITDSTGAQVDSGWSAEVEVVSPLSMSAPIAVLPIENLSGRGAPLRMIYGLLHSRFSERGFHILDPEVLEEFMKRYRVRNTSGLRAEVSRALLEETGAEAFLITSLEAYKDIDPPVIALFSRLVSSGERAEILWMDSVGLSGDGYPGFLGLGLRDDPEVLLEEAIHCLGNSLELFLRLTEEDAEAASDTVYYQCSPRADLVASPPGKEGRKRHRPSSFFRSPSLRADQTHRVALIPFLNLSDRNNAGNIVALHFINHLLRSDSFSVVEPGLVREQLLKYRMVMQAGPSLANVEIISSDISLGVDLVFSGTVFDYQDAFGTPKVEFSVKVLEAESRRTVWSSRSQNTGDDGVYFFDVGRVYTAHHLASDMAKGTFEALEQQAQSLHGQRLDPASPEGG